MKLTTLHNEFFQSEKVGGLLLILTTLISLMLANSPFHTGYTGFWSYEFGGHSIVQWINDGLMTVFFLMIGLELEREIYIGELRDIKKASLPVFAAAGGMLLPAGLYLVLNYGADTQSGAGIPMATDIAFAIGVMSLLGNIVPGTLKIFLTALAVIDDLGAIMIIALFYSDSLVLMNLLIVLFIVGILFVMNRLKVHNLIPYLVGGAVMWHFMMNSGIHPTLSGILLAFTIPFGDGGERSPSYVLQHLLHKPVAYLILPLFAMANTCLPFAGNLFDGIDQNYTLGIIAGLLIGKPLGILLFPYVAVWLRLSVKPPDLNWKIITGAGFLGGIGFTMSIFITLLAFDIPEVVNNSKIAVLFASLLAGTTGYFILKKTLKSGIGEGL